MELFNCHYMLSATVMEGGLLDFQESPGSVKPFSQPLPLKRAGDYFFGYFQPLACQGKG
jgi:hypothetical protein